METKKQIKIKQDTFDLIQKLKAKASIPLSDDTVVFCALREWAKSFDLEAN